MLGFIGMIERSLIERFVFYIFLLLTLINAFETVARDERYFDRALLRFQRPATISGLCSESGIRACNRILNYVKIIRVGDSRHHTYHHHSLTRVRQRQSKVPRIVQPHSFQRVLFFSYFVYLVYIFSYFTRFIVYFCFIYSVPKQHINV